MFALKNLTINQKGHLEIGGCDTTELAKEYGTPLYVMDEDRIRSNMRAYKNSIDKFYSGNGMALYASKALSRVLGAFLSVSTRVFACLRIRQRLL